ncbi:hypothetical protein JQ621_34830 [Bradyrhizobium manausense]|uniref:hypothetical protein n=1 Tax=Bradyrhizobium manausense TaxID=989370 RepID=UPI001BABDA7E|nr:hypothetical protein [Bradyrhizobium manausense]MBR1092649.1 hypothetical protein [Bradyrhizobium manausense]
MAELSKAMGDISENLLRDELTKLHRDVQVAGWSGRYDGINYFNAAARATTASTGLQARPVKRHPELPPLRHEELPPPSVS